MATLRRAVVVGLVVAAFVTAALTTTGSAASPWDGPFDPARLAGQIPEPLLGAYLAAADRWDIDWALLAAIGKLECDHGRHRAPGCWPPGTINRAGARGPMQWLGSTWRHTADPHDPNVAGPAVDDGAGYATDGDGDGIADPWSAYDAVHAAARYLVDVGGRHDPHRAAKAYNAGPANPDPTAGEAYATAADQLIVGYHQLAGPGPGASTVDAGPAPVGGGCTLDDPTGTGGCVTARAAHLLGQADRHVGPWRWPVACWSPHPWNPSSDHPHGRACDWTVGTAGQHPSRADRAVGWQLADWLVANAGRLAIAYIVWDGQIWSPQSGGWQPYSGGGIYNPGDPTGGHYDHVHVSVRP